MQLTPEQKQKAFELGISESQIASFENTGRAAHATSVAPTVKPQAQKPGFLDQGGAGTKIASGLDTFFGGGTLGKGIGGSLYGFSQLAKGDVKGFNETANSLPKPKEYAGDLLKMGTTLASAIFPPLKGKTALVRIGQASGIGAGFGASNAIAEAMKDDETFDKIWAEAKSGAKTGAVVGAVFQGAVEGMSAAGQKLYQSILNTTKTMEKKTLVGKLPSKQEVAGVLQKEGVAGSGEKVLQQVQERITQIDDEIQYALKQSTAAGKKVGSSDVIGATIGKTLDDLDHNIDKSVIEDILLDKNLPLKKLLEQDSISYEELNKVRSIIDKQYLGSTRWLSENPQPQKVLVLKNLANIIRNMVKSDVPETAQLFHDSRMLLVGSGMIRDKLASKPGVVRQLAESGLVAGGVAGAVTGAGIAFPAAMIGLVVGGRAATSPLVTTSLGKTITQLSSVAQKLPPTFTINQLINALYESESSKTGSQEGKPQQAPKQ